MTQAGNRVVFDSDGSFVLNKKTKKVTEIHETKGDYHMEVWVDCKAGEPGSMTRLAAVKEEQQGCGKGCQCPPPPMPHPQQRQGRQFRYEQSEDGMTTFLRHV